MSKIWKKWREENENKLINQYINYLSSQGLKCRIPQRKEDEYNHHTRRGIVNIKGRRLKKRHFTAEDQSEKSNLGRGLPL